MIEEYIDRLAQHEQLDGFDTDAGKRVLSLWVHSTVAKIGWKGRGRRDQQLDYIQPLHLLAYRAGLPAAGARHRRVHIFLYQLRATLCPQSLIVPSGLLMTSGTRRYFVVQRVLFAIAMGGLAVLAVLLAFASRDAFTANLSSLGGLDYAKVISTAEANGFSHQGFSLSASVSFVVFGWFALGAAVNSVALGGEIKRVRRSQLVGMFGALVCCALVISLFDLLATRAFGDTFQGAVAFNSINGVADASTESTVGASPYITVLSGILAGNIPLAVIILFTFVVWIWFWIPALVCYGTRSMIAWSFDRVAPDPLGYVSERFHTPVVAIWTFVVGGATFLWLVAYQDIAFLTMVEVLIAVWLVVLLAAMIFPYLRRGIYQTSPVSRLRLFGLPLMTITGFIALVYLGWVGYLMWNDPIAAGPLIKSPPPLEFWIVAGAIAVGALWYVGIKAYRARRGIDLRLAFQQIPIE